MDFSKTDSIVFNCLYKTLHKLYEIETNSNVFPGQKDTYDFLKTFFFPNSHDEHVKDILDPSKLVDNPTWSLNHFHFKSINRCFEFYDFIVKNFQNYSEITKKYYLENLKTNKMFYFCMSLNFYVILFEIWSILFTQCRNNNIILEIPFFVLPEKLLSKFIIKKIFNSHFKGEIKYHHQINPFYYFCLKYENNVEDSIFYPSDFSICQFFENNQKTFEFVPKKCLFVPYYIFTMNNSKIITNQFPQDNQIKDSHLYISFLLNEINLLQFNITALLHTLFQNLDSSKMEDFFQNHCCNYVFKQK